MRHPYNTGLGSHEYEWRRRLDGIDYAESERGIVFAHDVCNSLCDYRATLVMQKAECVYSELPWKSGWDTFHARAEVQPSGKHEDFVKAVKSLLMMLGKPAFIVCSKQDAEFLSDKKPCPIMLNGKRAWLAVYNVKDIPQVGDTLNLVRYLAGTYRSVYDFGCGYGNALREFEYFVGSDIDGKCLKFIEMEMLHGRS